MPVYFIQAGAAGPVKIGHAVDVAARMVDLQIANAAELRLLRTIEGGRGVEIWLHRRFAPLHIRGEWFSFSADMLAINPPQIVLEETPLHRAISLVGSQAKLAAALRVSQQTIGYWLNTKGCVAAEYALPIEQATNGEVKRHELRPDLFDPPPAEDAA